MIEQDQQERVRQQVAIEAFADNRNSLTVAAPARKLAGSDCAGGEAEEVGAGVWARGRPVAEDADRGLRTGVQVRILNREERDMTVVKDMKTLPLPGIAGEPLKIILASDASQRLASLAAGLRTDAGAELYQAESTGEVMELLNVESIELVIIDEALSDMQGMELARLLAEQQPFVNCILVSRLPADEFHERTEGLGVLMQLPSPPEMESARSIVTHLSAIKASQVIQAQGKERA